MDIFAGCCGLGSRTPPRTTPLQHPRPSTPPPPPARPTRIAFPKLAILRAFAADKKRHMSTPSLHSAEVAASVPAENSDTPSPPPPESIPALAISADVPTPPPTAPMTAQSSPPVVADQQQPPTTLPAPSMGPPKPQQAIQPKQPKAPKEKPAKPPVPAAAPGEKQLSAKELKEKKKAEKAARRAQIKASAPPQPTKPTTDQQKGAPKKDAGGPVRTIVLKGKPEEKAEAGSVVSETRRPTGLVGLLKDLQIEQDEKKKVPVCGIDHAHPDVHPAILTLGMQINRRVIMGSSARCMGFMLAMKRVIEDYRTPQGLSLNRHMPGGYLSHQVNFLVSARPMAPALGNAIRWLKTEISKLSPDVSDEEAKRELITKIENFIHEKLTAADEMIVNTACERYISHGDVILTFSKSQVVEKALLEAKRRGKRFRVIVADNRPLLEGRNLLKALTDADIECSYIHLFSLEYAVPDATKVFLGASAILANGDLYSRSGANLTAMAAHDAGVPVIVLCETIKFSDKINIDGIVSNELGEPELLVDLSRDHSFPRPGPLEKWKENKGMVAVSFRYDITPANVVSMVICEHGCVASEGVAGLVRVSGLDR